MFINRCILWLAFLGLAGCGVDSPPISAPLKTSAPRKKSTPSIAVKKPITQAASRELPWDKPVGIGNHGASCYFNGMMQLLFASKSFISAALKPGLKESLPKPEQASYDALKDLIEQRKKPGVNALKLQDLSKPLIESQGMSCSVQSDAEEIGRSLMDLVHMPALHIKEIKTLYKNNAVARVINKSEIAFLAMISVPKNAGEYNLQALVNDFSKIQQDSQPENQISIDNKIKSDYFESQYLISKLEDDVFLHLKRFGTEIIPHSNPLEIRSFKITSNILLPDDEIINLNKIITPELLSGGTNTRYRIKGITVQSGSLQSGHYFAYVRYGDQWWYCNDSSCAETTYSELKSQQAVLSGSYIIALERDTKKN